MGFKTINGRKVFIDDNKRTSGSGHNDESNGMKIGNGTRIPKTDSLEDFSISKTNWNIGFDSDGNIDDVGVHDNMAGFIWNSGKEDVGTFLGRIKKSKVTEQFVTETEDNPKIFDEFKKQWKENLGTGKIEVDKHDDGIYALSGDNGEWEQGGNEVEVTEAFNDVFENDVTDLTDEEKDKVNDKTFQTDLGYSYGDYLEEHGEGDRQEILEVLNSSDSFDELFDGLGTEAFEIQRLENVLLGKEGAFRITILEAIASLRKEGKIRESVEA
jgi:hypothetical protein